MLVGVNFELCRLGMRLWLKILLGVLDSWKDIVIPIRGSIAFSFSGKDVEMDMRHCLTGRTSVLSISK